MYSEVRWIQRFQNFDRAFARLEEALARPEGALSELEKEGVVQRFEYTFELAWKTLKDYLDHTGVSLEQITPRNVIKQAFASKLIPDGQVWIDMIEKRNLTSRLYDEKTFEVVVDAIWTKFYPALRDLRSFFQEHLGRA
ncbi:MAG: nucleotidyltransferase substrate binding protein [Candidatus Hydrogenedentes bacterium]|nr:nucleotidyltransferase substrate binding protein [Candidatus Hydrogenedentota bacterium]